MADDPLYFANSHPDYVRPFIIVSSLLATGLVLGILFMATGGWASHGSLAEHYTKVVASLKLGIGVFALGSLSSRRK
jgi:hypothetical protein